MRDIAVTSCTRVFIRRRTSEGDLSAPGLLPLAGVFRIWTDTYRHLARVILYSYVDMGEYLPFVTYANDFTLELIVGECRAQIEYDWHKVWFQMNNCHQRRIWWPNPVILNPDKSGALQVYAEYQSDHWSYPNPKLLKES